MSLLHIRLTLRPSKLTSKACSVLPKSQSLHVKPVQIDGAIKASRSKEVHFDIDLLRLIQGLLHHDFLIDEKKKVLRDFLDNKSALTELGMFDSYVKFIVRGASSAK